ncbi:hypothetical protein C8R43DRAFT_1136064 [Mycena crocata]|nr:hypothetical protein C8R43DRAFT_1136064 [Mycena crocata]
MKGFLRKILAPLVVNPATLPATAATSHLPNLVPNRRIRPDTSTQFLDSRIDSLVDDIWTASDAHEGSLESSTNGEDYSEDEVEELPNDEELLEYLKSHTQGPFLERLLDLVLLHIRQNADGPQRSLYSDAERLLASARTLSTGIKDPRFWPNVSLPTNEIDLEIGPLVPQETAPSALASSSSLFATSPATSLDVTARVASPWIVDESDPLVVDYSSVPDLWSLTPQFPSTVSRQAPAAGRSSKLAPRRPPGAYPELTLPPAVTPAQIELEQPRRKNEEFSLQMIIPAGYCATAHDTRMPLAAVFVPKQADIACALVETPPGVPPQTSAPDEPTDSPLTTVAREKSPSREKSSSRHIPSTRLSHRDMDEEFISLRERLVGPELGPQELDIREEVELVSIERTPANVDDIWKREQHYCGPPERWRIQAAQAAARRMHVDAVGEAMKNLDENEPLEPGTPFTMKVVQMPEVTDREAAVLFVPDDPRIPGLQTWHQGSLLHTTERPQVVRTSQFMREVDADGKWELLGRHKRRRVVDDYLEVDGERVPKKSRGEGHDTITHHSLLNTWDDPWVEKHSKAKAFFAEMAPHMRPKEILTPKDARHRADKLRQELFSSWHRLRAIVLAHGETIQKRWKKRTALKRKQLLTDINPQLPKEHAPEIEALYRGDVQSAGQDRHDYFLLPYLNLEDLSMNNGILCAVHHSPSEFAWFDASTLHFGIISGGIKESHGLDCSMVTLGDEDTYGKVLEYSEPFNASEKDSPDGFEMEHHLLESMYLGDRLVVLEAQSKLMVFLITAVTKILTDFDLINPTPNTPLPRYIFQAATYSGSPVLHLADLRTDPLYLAETLRSYYDHRIETIFGKAPPSLVQYRTVALMLSDAYTFLACYHIARAVIDDFRSVQAKYLNGLLETHMSKQGYHNTISSSSALRAGLSVSCTDPAFAEHKLVFEPRPQDKLYTYIVILLQEDQTHLWQLTQIFDQLDRIVQDPTEHRRISSLVANLLSQWGVVHDCKSIVEWHRPAVGNDEELQAGIQKCLQKWRSRLASIIRGDNSPTLADKATAYPCDKAFPVSQFVYPKGPRNQEWAHKCERVDELFTAFWAAADKALLKMAGSELFLLGKSLVAPFIVGQTDWVALGTKAPVSRAKPTPSAALLPFGGATQTMPAKEEALPLKFKPKTHGVAAVQNADAANALVPGETVSAAEVMQVATKAYKVLSTLFTAAKDEAITLSP